jgi:hypothetical protein
MNSVNETNVQNYLNVVQQTSKRNTLTQVADAKQSGNPVDAEQLQSSNKELRASARETSVTLFSQQLQKQAFETYANTSENNTNNTDSDDEKNSSDVYTFDASKANDTLQTVQQRTLAVAAYENQSEGRSNTPDYPDLNKPSPQPVNVYV